MRQITQIQRSGQLATTEVPAPLLQSTGVVVRTAYSLISAGTERQKIEVAKKSLVGKALAKPEQVRQVLDMVRQVGVAATYQKVAARLNALSPLGYSSAGVVVVAGSQATDLQPGDLVACAGAGYANHAEYIYVPRNLCARVPAGVPLDQAAYATVGAIALQGVRQAEPTLGETVVVIGLGLLGILAVQLLKANGCRVVGVDVDPHRCELAVSLGADAALAPGDSALEPTIRRHAPGGADAVVLCAATDSSEPVRLAGRLCRDKGRVVIVGAVGLDIPRSPFYEKEIDIRLSRSYGPGRYDPGYEERGQDYPIGYVRWTEGRNLDAVLDQIAQGRLDVRTLTTHRFTLDQSERAYELLENKTGERYLGILLDYGAGDGLPTPAAERPIVTRSGPGNPKGRVAVGLLGAGAFAQSMLLPHLAKDPAVRLRGVATNSGLTARSVADRAGFDICAPNAEAVLADSETDLLVVATRHDSHASLSAQGLAAGKAVFVEKPLAVTEDQLDQVVAAWHAARGPFLMVGFNRRFAPLVVEMKAVVAGAGEPKAMTYRVNAGFVPPEHWVQDPAAGGGRIVGEVCHFVDLLAFLCDSAPVEVFAQALPDGGRYRRDNVQATVTFDDGSVGVITYVANGAKAIEKERIEVFAGGRTAILEDFKALTIAEGTRRRRKAASPDKGHQAEMAALVAAVKEGRPSPIPFEQSLAATRATFAILQSLATGLPIAVTPRP